MNQNKKKINTQLTNIENEDKFKLNGSVGTKPTHKKKYINKKQ